MYGHADVSPSVTWVNQAFRFARWLRQRRAFGNNGDTASYALGFEPSPCSNPRARLPGRLSPFPKALVQKRPRLSIGRDLRGTT
jgi:hypothetical protein